MSLLPLTMNTTTEHQGSFRFRRAHAFLAAGAAALLLVAASGCGNSNQANRKKEAVNSPEDARLKLAQLSVEYSPVNFVAHAAGGDTIVTKLFLEAGINVNSEWFRKAVEQDSAWAQCNLGVCYQHGRGVAKDEAEAVKWFRKAARIPENVYADETYNVYAWNSLAWILATSENSAIRDGANAVVFAEKAVIATNRKKTRVLDTLAAAYAEAGQFEKAVSTEQEAIALLQTEAEKNDYKARLKLFEAKVPYRAKD